MSETNLSLPLIFFSVICFEMDTNYYGSDLGGIANVPNYVVCREKCTENPDCVSFTHIVYQNGCYLKNDIIPKEALGMVSGQRTCTKP